MSSATDNAPQSSIKQIDKLSIHRITSGQVVIDLQTAVKELVENSLDAGATNLEVKFKQYGLTSIEVIDNGSGIAEADYDSIGLKHHTSKLTTYTDLAELHTFGFRGEALSSLCALCQSVQVTTSISAPMGTCLDLDTNGRVKQRKTVARQRGTTVALKGLFQPLPVRRKELERNIKREFSKALSLLNAYALLPCTIEPGVRLTVSNQLDKGTKSQLIVTQGVPSIRRSVTALWGPKALDNIVDLKLDLEVERERGNRRLTTHNAQTADEGPLVVSVRGLISKFSVACGRTGTDRQFLFVNGRPCNLNKVQKTFNEVYRSFNANQSPFLVADFIIAPDTYDVNVSPDKRTIFLQGENNLITALKAALESHFDSQRSTFDVINTQTKVVQTSLDQPSHSQRPRFTVTNNMSRMLRRSPSPSTSDVDLATSLLENSDPRSAILSEQIVHSETSTNKSRKPEEPLFIPDPDDDMNPTNSDSETDVETSKEPAKSEIIAAQLSLPPARDQNPDVEVVVDTSQASWNRPTQARQIVRDDLEPAGSHSDNSESDSDLGRPRKRRKPDAEVRPVSPVSVTVRARDQGKTEKITEQRQKPGHSQPATGASRIRKGAMTMHNFLSNFASSQTQSSGDSPAILEEESLENAVSEDEETLDERADGVKANSEGDLEETQIVDSPINSNNASHQVSDSLPVPDDHDHDHGEMDVDDQGAPSVLSSVQESLSSSSAVSRTDHPVRPEIIRTAGDDDIAINFELDKIRVNYLKLTSHQARVQSPATQDHIILEDAGLSNTDDEARVAEVLSRVIDKTDFAEMEVVGQFNLGFIIARRRKSTHLNSRVMDDLFIVDQHAADEKYNFETLQQTTTIQSQKLFRPRPLEFTASDEVVATENIEVLRKNGFEIEMTEKDTLPGSSRLMLTAQPVSKSTVFDMKDLEELIHLMRDRPNGQMIRCSKARAMFAMRACRKSVMIGMPMNRHQMLSVVHHMGTMDQPWNCPHGRPTMRHLADLEGLTRQKRGLDWRRLT